MQDVHNLGCHTSLRSLKQHASESEQSVASRSQTSAAAVRSDQIGIIVAAVIAVCMVAYAIVRTLCCRARRQKTKKAVGEKEPNVRT